MPRLAGADEIVMAEFQALKGFLEGGGVLVGPFLGGQLPFGGRVDDFRGVFIGAGQEKDVIAFQPMIAREDIGNRRGVDMPDMRPIIDVIDRGGDVKLVHCGGWDGSLASSVPTTNERIFLTGSFSTPYRCTSSPSGVSNW